MGLSDIVRGMRNGPRGERQRRSGGWVSRLMFAAMGLLAYKTFSGRNQNPDPNTDREPPRRRWL